MEWKNIYRGLLMGITDLIPGVSGGTVAFILGIYDRLLASISGFFSREWKKHLRFLVPLGIGMVAALLIFSRFIDYLLEHHLEPTQFFFMGLIIGVIPFILRQASAKQNFKGSHIVVLMIVAILLASLAFVKPNEAAEPITSLSLPIFFGLFFSGWLASMAMLLPGISGSFILLLLGVYTTAIRALKDFNLPLIMVIGAGVIVGFIVSSKAIRYLLSNFQYMTYAVIVGLIFGSFFVMFPGIPTGGNLIASIITFIASLTFSLWFSSEKVAGKN